MIKPSELESLRQQYPVGARVELIQMNDPFSPPPPGTKGTVRCVDDIGNIHVDWDNGSGLAVDYDLSSDGERNDLTLQMEFLYEGESLRPVFLDLHVM